MTDPIKLYAPIDEDAESVVAPAPLHRRLRDMARHCDSVSYTSNLDKSALADLLHEAADVAFAASLDRAAQ